VLTSGDGPFGLLIARLSLRLSPGRVILVGAEDFRLNYVPEAVCLNLTRTPNLSAAIADAAGGHGVDIAILAVASADAMDVCLQSLRPRGRLVIFAHLPGEVRVDIGRVHLKELEILGACNDEDYFDEALACLFDPELRLDELITHRLPFAEWRTAFDLAARRKSEALKVTLIL
jgi:L-iditol 2-dehydrogenase